MNNQLTTAERMEEAHRRMATDPTGGLAGPSAPWELTTAELAAKVERARTQAAAGDKGAQAWLAAERNQQVIANADQYQAGYQAALNLEPRLHDHGPWHEGFQAGLAEHLRRTVEAGRLDRHTSAAERREFLADTGGKAVA